MALNIATLVARVVADTSGFNRGMAGAESRLAATSESMRRTGRTMTTSLTLPIIATAAVATKFAIDFQQQMEMIHTQAGASQAEVMKMHDAVLALAPATRYGPEELAKALYHIESVGARGATAMNVLKVATQGAATGNSDLEDTASALAGTMRVYHEPAANAVKVMGDLNAVVGAGNMRMQDLNKAIGTGLLPTAQGMGLSIREVGAALAVMTDESTPAQVAATRMRTLLLLMSGETKKSQDVLEKLGISSLQMGHLMHQPGGMIPALTLLKEKLDKVTKDPTLQTQFLAKAFGGARSSGTVIQLLNNLEFVRTKLDQINRTAGNFPEAFLRTQQTEVFKLHSAWAAVQTVLIRIGEIIAPVVSQIAAAIARLLQHFQNLSPAMQKVIIFGSLIAAAIGPLMFIIGALISPLGLVVAAVGALVGAGVALYERYQGVRDVFNSVADAIKAVLGFTGLWHSSLHGATVDAIAASDQFKRMQAVTQALASTWRQVGPYLNSAFQALSNAARVVAVFVVQQFNTIRDAIKSHSAEIRLAITNVWNAIVAITRTVWPLVRQIIETTWAAIKVIVQTAMRVIGNVILAVMRAINGDWHGAWEAIKAATGALLKGIVSLISTLLRGLIPVVLTIASAIGKALWEGIKKVVPLLASLPGLLIAGISAACSAAAAAAVGLAAQIGSSIMHGIISGIGGLGSSLAGKLKSEVTGAIGGLAGHLGIKSPSTVTRDKIGKPLAQGIVEGFLLGITDLPTKMNAKLNDALQKAQKVVQGAQQHFADAFTRLSDYAMRAFDGKTQQHLDQMKVTFDSKIKRLISDPLEKAMSRLQDVHDVNAGKISSARDALTPAEWQLQAVQDAHAEAQRQGAVNDAQAALADAQTNGKPEDIIKAQDDLKEALYAQTIAGLQKQADAERLAANAQADLDQKTEDDRYAAAQKAMQAQFDAQQAALQKVYDTQVLNYQSQRDLQKQHLGDTLAELQKQLNLHPGEWKKIHARIMKMFREDFGADYKTAGTNLGIGFAQGIRESFGQVASVLHEFANLVAKYLKLHSPAEKGPLSDLDTWWNAFVPTLTSSIDQSAMEASLTGMLSSRARTPGANTLGGGSLTQTGARAGSAPLVHIEHQHIHNEVDPLAAAVTLGRKLAFR